MEGLFIFGFGLFVGFWIKAPSGNCADCGKFMRDKPILGTAHFCVSDEVAAQRRAIQAQANAQMADMKRRGYPVGGFGQKG